MTSIPKSRRKLTRASNRTSPSAHVEGLRQLYPYAPDADVMVGWFEPVSHASLPAYPELLTLVGEITPRLVGQGGLLGHESREQLPGNCRPRAQAYWVQ
jgi:hypothetical protein